MDLIVDVVGAIGFAWLVLLVHEYGHLAVARAAGMPKSDVRVVLDSWPAHTSLRDGPSWLAPDDPGYIEAFRRHRNTPTWSAAFIAGGYLMEVPVALIAIKLLAKLSSGPAEVLAWTTAVLSITYLVADIAISRTTGRPYGDHIALWQLSRPLGIFLVFGILAGKALGIVIVL